MRAYSDFFVIHAGKLLMDFDKSSYILHVLVISDQFCLLR